MKIRSLTQISLLVGFLLLSGSSTEAQSITNLESRVTRHTLENGLRFLMLERHTSPTISCHVFFNVGSVNDPAGQSGIAHMYEHMAFKGTSTVGTKNASAELPLMKEQDEVAATISSELDKGEKADLQKIADLEKKMDELEKQQDQLIVDNEFSEYLERNGAVGLNAETGRDATEYYVSLPANKIELWASLESDRMVNTVLRQFYKERSVVLEERRLRIDNQPLGKLFEKFVVNAFEAHPYRLHSGIGWPSDLQHLTRSQTEAFYRKYYVPSNAIVAIVGDFKTDDLVAMLDRYFGPLPVASRPAPIHTLELPQQGTKKIQVEFDAQPSVLIGYHRPDSNHPDDAILDVIANLLATGRTSRLYRNIVETRQIAAEVTAWDTLPMTYGRYPNLFTLAAAPIAGHTVDEVANAMEEELEKLKREPVSARELQKNINQVDAAFIRRLRSNSTMAAALTEAEGINGDWKSLIDYKERVAHVTPADIQRVAARYFTDSNKVLAYIAPKPSAAAQTQQAEDSKQKPPALQEKKTPEDKKADQEERPKGGEEQKKAAQELWQKALAAEGGLDALKAVKTRITTGWASVITSDETFNGPMTTVVAYPDKISRQFTIGGDTVSRTLVKEDLWIFTTKARQITMIAGALKPGKSNAEGMQLKMLLEADPVSFFVLGSDSSVEKTPLDPLEGMPGLKVKLPTGHVFNAYFNAQTFLLERLIYSVQYYGETTLKYSDFRPVTGIQFPFRIEIFRGPAKTEEQLISDVKLNVPVPEDIFRAPQ